MKTALGSLSAVLLTFCAAQTGSAQPIELAYDDGTPAGAVQLSPGDIEVVRFTAEHPSTLLSIRLFFYSVSSDATVVVWADNGGNAPDLEAELWRGIVAPEDGDWTLVDLGDEGIEIPALESFYVGQIVSDASTLLGWDSSGADETRSLARIDGEWFFIGDGGEPPMAVDCLVRATVSHHDQVTIPGFTVVTTALAQGSVNLSRMAWGDFDNDGWEDLLVNGNRLFRNDRDGTFTEVSEAAGIAWQPSSGGIWADYDNDGWLDFYATVHNYLPECAGLGACADDSFECVEGRCRPRPRCAGPSDCSQAGWSCTGGRCAPAVPETEAELPHDRLWRNNGDGTFTDVSEEAGRPYDFFPTEGAAWGDFDNDGCVDLYLANYETPTSWTAGVLGVGTPDYLFRNNGDGTFTDVSEDSGIRGFPDLCGRGVAWADYDDDGWIDIYVSNYRLDFNLLWRNKGNGRFDMTAGQAGVAGEQIQGAYGHTIGSQWADLDNDGDWDLFAANLAHPRFIEFSDKSMLYVSSGPPDYTFLDQREASGIRYSETHSDVAAGDYDNDGLLDLFITGVYVGYRSFLYRNLGGLRFSDETYAMGALVDNGWGAAWADFDNDGDLDLVSRDLFRNDAPSGRYLKIRLRGTISNRAAIGARVKLQAGGQSMTRQVEGGKGTTTQSSLTLHFGLGEAERAELVEITWPTWPPLTETYADLEVNRTATFIEGQGEQADGGADGGAGDAGPGNGDGNGGCGCRASSGPGTPTLALLVLVFLLALPNGRRRSRGRHLR
ncbi:MAG: CRTAC1 family protein [Polyangia bacterium]|jgi:MYXO-CTERM domain-containing protein|nr:CRTAC1 family protein [Polyangia bacterium]